MTTPQTPRRSRAELDALTPHVLDLLRAGHTVAQIRAETRLGPNQICDLRRRHNIPVPHRDLQAARRHTIDQALTLHTTPTDGGHLIWTGPRSGRGVDLIAAGHTHNARAVAFLKHHSRPPDGVLRRTCDRPDCIAGAHHTDHRIRQQKKASKRPMTAVRQDIAAMLRAGATLRHTAATCGVSVKTVATVRKKLRIPVPAARARRTPGEIRAAEDQALTMLRAGATVRTIYQATRISQTRIGDLRRQHTIPVPDHDSAASRRLTLPQALARHTHTDGDHLIFTGDTRNRFPVITAGGRQHGARAVAFEQHHGRRPDGVLRRTCDRPDCIAGAHHTDRRIREANTRADNAYTAIFGQDT